MNSIKRLLDEEKVAMEAVAEAKQQRAQKLREARTEALAEIEHIEEEKKHELEVLKEQRLEKLDSFSEQLQSDTAKHIDELYERAQVNFEKAVLYAVDDVINVTL
ncbi:hypothetical protein PCE1_004616 [Barthelona sp. PCE]